MKIYVFVTMYDYRHIKVIDWTYEDARRQAGLNENEIAYYGVFETEKQAQLQMGM